MPPGRNDPCPCGSGKKFKKCCGVDVSFTTSPAVKVANGEKALDRELMERLLRFARVRFGPEWLDSALDEYADDDTSDLDQEELQLAMPWLMFHNRTRDQPDSIATMFAAENWSRLSRGLKRLLDANFSSWLSVWEVKEVEKGVGALVSDLLSGEERFVHEVLGTESLDLRSAILARVVDSNGISFFGGVHPQPLPSRDADLVVREMKRVCRRRTRPVAIEALQHPAVQWVMIDLWREISHVRLQAPPPAMVNTEGDSFSLTNDHYDIITRDRNLLLERLVALPGARDLNQDSKGETSLVITREDASSGMSGETIIARIVVEKKRLRVECNSLRRANTVRAMIQASLGDVIKYRLRDETSMADLLRQAGRAGPVEEATPEMIAIAKEYKEWYMATWPDMEIPALGGLTPREAAKKPHSRAQLEILLRDMEMYEAGHAEEERYDVGKLRDLLGMVE